MRIHGHQFYISLSPGSKNAFIKLLISLFAMFFLLHFHNNNFVVSIVGAEKTPLQPSSKAPTSAKFLPTGKESLKDVGASKQFAFVELARTLIHGSSSTLISSNQRKMEKKFFGESKNEESRELLVWNMLLWKIYVFTKFSLSHHQQWTKYMRRRRRNWKKALGHSFGTRHEILTTIGSDKNPTVSCLDLHILFPTLML